MAHTNQQRANAPLYLDRSPRTAEELIAMGAEIMADYLEPDGGLTDRDVVNRMLELFDNPTAVEALDREMQRRAGGRDVDNWH
ncbi:MAG: hypothetical protein ABIQ30_01640 [Devosia sp.]